MTDDSIHVQAFLLFAQASDHSKLNEVEQAPFSRGRGLIHAAGVNWSLDDCADVVSFLRRADDVGDEQAVGDASPTIGRYLVLQRLEAAIRGTAR